MDKMNPFTPDTIIFWFRRDLRLEDNTALNAALASNKKVVPIFIFDPEILSQLSTDDKRLSLIYNQLSEIHSELQKLGSGIHIIHTQPKAFFSTINCGQVYFNEDYEPFAIKRDQEIVDLLKSKGIETKTFKDQVIFSPNEILKENGTPYHVYTPYSKRWKAQFNDLRFPTTTVNLNGFLVSEALNQNFPSLKSFGFKYQEIKLKPFQISEHYLENYEQNRDIPSLDATSHLSIFLRFGFVSVRTIASQISGYCEKLLNELIWREFFQTILFHYPKVVSENFNSSFNQVHWLNNSNDFDRWKEGLTGYPLVDAGMRELNATGYMHNRVRMVCASFLTKHLLIHWSLGEAYFASKLLDYDLASNNGNWQWVAGTGCDAAPYFRIFNPEIQQKKFDPKESYIKKWIPEFGTPSYPSPIVEHAKARDRALATIRPLR